MNTCVEHGDGRVGGAAGGPDASGWAGRTSPVRPSAARGRAHERLRLLRRAQHSTAPVLPMANVAVSSGLMMVVNAARNGFFYGVKVRSHAGAAVPDARSLSLSLPASLPAFVPGCLIRADS